MADNKAKTTALFCAYSGQSMARRWVRPEDIFNRNGEEMALIRWASNRYRYDAKKDALVSRATGQIVPFHPNALKNEADAAPEIFVFEDPNNVSPRSANKAAKQAEREAKKAAKVAEREAKKAAKQAKKEQKAKKAAAEAPKPEPTRDEIDEVMDTGTVSTLPSGLEPIIEATPAIVDSLADIDEVEPLDDDDDELGGDDEDDDDDDLETDDDDDEDDEVLE